MVDFEVKQIRQVELDRINQNPTIIVVESRAEIIDNGFGVKVPDMSTPLKTLERGPVRIELRTSTLEYQVGTSEPLGTHGQYILFATYDALWLKRGLIIRHFNKKYKTEEVVNLKYNGETISKVCNLKVVSSTIDYSPNLNFTVFTEEEFTK